MLNALVMRQRGLICKHVLQGSALLYADICGCVSKHCLWLVVPHQTPAWATGDSEGGFLCWLRSPEQARKEQE